MIPAEKSGEEGGEALLEPGGRVCLPPLTTEDPMWGHPMPVLGALSPFLEPFRGHLSPKVDEIFQK